MAKERTLPAASDMLPPDVAQKQAQPSASKSTDCPIKKLPAEIIHMICVYLRPTELANLRLVYRPAGPISLEYMVPEVHLALAKESFEQLKAIAAHPIASKHVTSFFFEADRFSERSRRHWEQYGVGPECVAHLQGQSCRYASDGSLWIYEHALVSTPRYHSTEKEMARTYEKIAELLRLQKMHPEVTEMAEAMKRFPRLNELKMTISDCGRSRTSRLVPIFQPALTDCYETDATPDPRLEPLGLQQMRSLLLGAYHAGLKVETLQCGLVDWRVFDQASETFARMKDGVSNVKNLRLDFDTGDEIYYTFPWGIPGCLHDHEGRLGDFITAASKLEHLQIGFNLDVPEWPPCLENIVGEHHWPSLKSINLKMISTTEEQLVSFCSRHASTLKSVHLSHIRMLEGDWYDALDRMRSILTLDTIVLEGILKLSPTEDLDPQEDAEGHRPRPERGLENWFLRACLGAEKDSFEFMESYEREIGRFLIF